MAEAARTRSVEFSTQELPAFSAAWRSDHIEFAAYRERCARNRFSRLMQSLYRFRRLRALVRRIALRLEGGPLFSQTIRDLLKFNHGVVVGPYSYGDILKPGVLQPGSEVGAYCSVGCDLIVRRRDHPIDRISQSPLFYNRKLGLVRRDTISDDRDNPLIIENDVWIGDRVTILSGCNRIGNGAVLAAGAVVTRNVEPYTVVGGVPAVPIRRRFSKSIIESLEASRWWTFGLSELLQVAPALLTPAGEVAQEDLLRLAQRATGTKP